MQSGIANVYAQNITSITVTHPQQMTVGDSEFVDVHVVYTGAHNLIVGIVDSSTGGYVNGGLEEIQPSFVSLHGDCGVGVRAVCGIVMTQHSGELRVLFYVKAPMIADAWKLEAIATIVDDNFNPIYSSERATLKMPFTIRIVLTTTSTSIETSTVTQTSVSTVTTNQTIVLTSPADPILEFSILALSMSLIGTVLVLLRILRRKDRVKD
jgi:hypothetical protein